METALVRTAAAKADRDKPLSERLFRTGQVARLLGVAPRSVSKWIDTGKLKGFRLPGNSSDGTGDRRVYGDDLVAFMRDRGWRVPDELLAAPPSSAVVAVFALSGCPIPTEFRCAADPLAFGALVAGERLAAAVIGDDEGLAAALSAARMVRSRHPEARIVFALSPDISPEQVLSAGFADCEVLARPEAREKLPLLLAG